MSRVRYTDHLRANSHGLMPSNPIAPATIAAVATAQPSLGQQEAVRHTGRFINALAFAAIVISSITPVGAYLLFAITPAFALLVLGPTSLLFMLAGSALHLLGRRYVEQAQSR